MIMAFSRSLQVSAGPRVTPKEEWWNKNCPDNMREINSVQQFVDELVRHVLLVYDLRGSHAKTVDLAAEEHSVIAMRASGIRSADLAG